MAELNNAGNAGCAAIVCSPLFVCNAAMNF